MGTVEWQGTQYFYLVEIISDTFGTVKGVEFTNKVKDKGQYVPLWISIDDLDERDVRPREVARKVQLLGNSSDTNNDHCY